MKKLLGLCLLLPCLLTAVEVPKEVAHKLEKMDASSAWRGLYYDVMPKLIKERGYKKVVEVGLGYGGHAEQILKSCDLDAYFGVDPFQYNYDVTDGFNGTIGTLSEKHDGQTNFDFLYSWIKDVRLEKYKNKFTLIRKPSVEAAQDFADESLDCIFIDGNHRYEQVLADLKQWYPKLKRGGTMAGDDYWMPEVAAAVTDFFRSKNKPVALIRSSKKYKIWAVVK